MDIFWALYFYFARPLLSVLFWVFIIWSVCSILVGVGVINSRNPTARTVLGFLDAVCLPLCRPIRRIIPPINGVLDLSGLFVVLAIVFVRDWALPTLLTMTVGPPYAAATGLVH